MGVKRYNTGITVENKEGKYVTYADYEKLKLENNELKKKLAFINSYDYGKNGVKMSITYADYEKLMVENNDLKNQISQLGDILKTQGGEINTLVEKVACLECLGEGEDEAPTMHDIVTRWRIDR